MRGNPVVTFGKTTLIKAAVIGVGIVRDQGGLNPALRVVVYTLGAPITISAHSSEWSADAAYKEALGKLE